MHTLDETKRNHSTGRVRRLAVAVAAAMLPMAATPVRAQAPGIVFSNPYYLGAASSSGTNQDFEATIGRVAANQRGDIFVVNNNFSGTNDQMVMVPAGTNNQVLVVSNLGSSSQSVATDAQGNLWVMNGNYGVLFIPVIEGVYPTALDASTITTYCTLPAVGNNTSPCLLSLATPHRSAIRPSAICNSMPPATCMPWTLQTIKPAMTSPAAF